MAVSIAELTSTTIVSDTDADETSENDVRGGATTLYGIYADNTANTGLVYLKFYDNVNPTVGTTDPDMILEIEGSSGGVNGGDVFIPINGGTGMAFANGLSFACVTTGGTAGTTEPTSAVKVALVVS